MTINSTTRCPFSGAPATADEPSHHVLDVPVVDVDPFDEGVLASPYAMHEQLREADGDVVYIPAYDIYAVARYDAVHATLENWQHFSSAAGVGLANFHSEKPWRAPSLLLEADAPQHDAPRAVLEKILGARKLRHYHEHWRTTAHELLDGLFANTAHRNTDGAVELDAVTEISEVYPLSVFPDAVGLQQGGLENLLPYGSFAFNAFGPRNRLVTESEIFKADETSVCLCG